MACLVKSSRQGKAFIHVDSGDQNGSGPKGGTAANPPAGCIEWGERLSGISEEEDGGGKREEEESEEDEGYILQKMKVPRRSTGEHDGRKCRIDVRQKVELCVTHEVGCTNMRSLDEDDLEPNFNNKNSYLSCN